MRRSNIIRMVNDKHRCPYENIFPILICVFIFSLEYFFLWKWWNIHVYFFNTISESLNKLLCFLLIRVVLAGKHMLSFMNSLYLSSSLSVSRQTNALPLHPLLGWGSSIQCLFFVLPCIALIKVSVLNLDMKRILFTYSKCYVNRIHAHICISNLAFHKSWNE